MVESSKCTMSEDEKKSQNSEHTDYRDLFIACWTGDLETVKELTSRIDVSRSLRFCKKLFGKKLLDGLHFKLISPLTIACHRAHYDIVDFLLKNGAKVDGQGGAPMKEACGSPAGDYETITKIVELLLIAGAEPNTLGKFDALKRSSRCRKPYCYQATVN